eukprot:Unigene1349_Nuclearia_a/m.4286 Unigene1349_Nuclearia_a/g.4286  ORF Unigene1349_Nuclearia_a/g.4286 Unigene1349_Nuclearia_a/m.4286 type:complete len:347 (+) Unigene1349_Nuclearia_a:16-1056(+)
MDLVALALVERDRNADVLVTWSYPLLPEGCDAAVLPKMALGDPAVPPPPFLFLRHKELWVYAVTTTATPFPGLPKISAASTILFAKNFNPEKYRDLATKLLAVHTASGAPPRVLQAYLAVMARGAHDFGGSLGPFALGDYDDRRALTMVGLKDLISSFKTESILIYNAVLLKKRIVVYSASVERLQQATRTLPALAWHRQNWALVRPYVLWNDTELQELSTLGVYIAGFTDRSIENREDLYDLFLDVDDSTAIVAQQAKGDFMMGKAHKELVQFLIATAQDAENNSEGQLIKAISQRTKQFVTTLDELTDAATGRVTVEAIKAKEMPTAMSRFYWNLALAEDRASL